MHGCRADEELIVERMLEESAKAGRQGGVEKLIEAIKLRLGGIMGYGNGR